MAHEAVRLAVHVLPRAGEERVGPYRDGVLEVRVTRPPADGEANRAVLRLLAHSLGVAPSQVRLASGERSRHKRVAISGIDAAELRRRLDGLEDRGPGG